VYACGLSRWTVVFLSASSFFLFPHGLSLLVRPDRARFGASAAVSAPLAAERGSLVKTVFEMRGVHDRRFGLKAARAQGFRFV